MEKEIIVIQGVNGYVEKGVAYLKLEDVAKGLGFVETVWNNTLKSDVQRIHSGQVKKHLVSVGFLNESEILTLSEQFIPENIFYKLCMKANNNVARAFQDLVCDEILPSIRKHGMYATENTIERMIENPDFAISLLTKLKEERAMRVLAEEEVVKQKPKVEYYDKVLQSDGLLTVTMIAKDLGMSAIALNSKLKELKIQYKKSKVWILYAQHEHRVPEYADYSITEFGQNLKFTEKGRQWIIDLLNKD